MCTLVLCRCQSLGELAALQLIVLFLSSPCACSDRRASPLHRTLWLNSRILLSLRTGFTYFASVHVSTTARAYNIFADFPMVFTISACDDPGGRVSGFTDPVKTDRPCRLLSSPWRSVPACVAIACRIAMFTECAAANTQLVLLHARPWPSR